MLETDRFWPPYPRIELSEHTQHLHAAALAELEHRLMFAVDSLVREYEAATGMHVATVEVSPYDARRTVDIGNGIQMNAPRAARVTVRFNTKG